MAENVSWILQKVQQRGNDCIFISWHNEHIAKWGSYDSMGKLLSNQYRLEQTSIRQDAIYLKEIINVPYRHFILMIHLQKQQN